MRNLFAIMLATLFAAPAMAQGSYMIQLDADANLRASWSLDSELATRAPQGTQLTVLKHFNRWLKVDYRGEILWLADWVLHTRLDEQSAAPAISNMSAAPAAPKTAPAASSYFIRLQTQANLRDRHSLDSDIVAVLAEDALLNVVESFNRWLRVEYAEAHAWLADWVRHTRLSEQEVDALLNPPPPVYVDNCCQLGRGCNTDAHWIGGYQDFLAGMCPVPSDTDINYLTPDVAPLVNNCCLIGRNCDGDQDWQRGYYDYARNMCGGPAMMMSG